MVGMLNKLPIALSGLILFDVPVTLPSVSVSSPPTGLFISSNMYPGYWIGLRLRHRLRDGEGQAAVRQDQLAPAPAERQLRQRTRWLQGLNLKRVSGGMGWTFYRFADRMEHDMNLFSFFLLGEER